MWARLVSTPPQTNMSATRRVDTSTTQLSPGAVNGSITGPPPHSTRPRADTLDGSIPKAARGEGARAAAAPPDAGQRGVAFWVFMGELSGA